MILEVEICKCTSMNGPDVCLQISIFSLFYIFHFMNDYRYEPERGSAVAGHRGYFLKDVGVLLNQVRSILLYSNMMMLILLCVIF